MRGKRSKNKSLLWVQAGLNHKQYQGSGKVNLAPLPNKIIDKLKKVFGI